MTVTPGEFDEPTDDDRRSPLLPPDDRLWRHPSEVGGRQPALPLDPVAVRRRWLLSHPSRRSALTAGVVGALLATGVVALGTHLADSMGGAGLARLGNAPGILQSNAITPAPGYELSPALVANVTRVSDAMVFVDATRGRTRVRVRGLIVRSDGMILVPAAGVTRAASLLVTLANGDLYVGSLVGTDTTSGLAVVHINGATGLPTVALSPDPMAKGSFALAVTTPGGTAFSLGTVRGLYSRPRVDGHRLLGALSTDLSPSSGPPGSPLLASTGAVEGVITGSTRAGAVVAPSWLAAPVADELIATGKVSHGWLGLEGTTKTGVPAGVRVTAVMAKGSLASAGIKPGDVIVSLDRSPVVSLAELRARLYVLKPGTRVRIGVVRGAVTTEHAVVLGGTPDS
ncbi:MAG TPA: PDZ domain-containing protein [Acidimicrobiales bacterium]|nr:PDZ domain-containing protein [Acidimicrobiales bacterium]